MPINVEEVDRLENFLGYLKNIHKTIYRVPVPVAEITTVSKHLLTATRVNAEQDHGNKDLGNCEPLSEQSTSTDNSNPVRRKKKRSRKFKIYGDTYSDIFQIFLQRLTFLS